MCVFMAHRLVLILHWLSGNSVATFREERWEHYHVSAPLNPVLGINLKTYKALVSHWRTHDFSFLCTSEYGECSCHWAFYPVNIS